jgi:integrase
MVHIRDGHPEEPTMPSRITEAVRARALRRPFVPAVYRDADIKGLALHVTRTRAFWALSYQLRGINPRTGKRHGGGKRFELGDAVDMPLDEARTAALKAKARIGEGYDPLGERLARRASLAAERAIVPTTVAEALDAFERMLMAKTTPKPSLQTRVETVRYARKAVRLMRAETIPIGGVSKLMVRLMLDEFAQSQAERRLTFSGLNQFLTWCRRREMIERNPLDDLDRDERPKPGAPRKNVPSLALLRQVWDAVETEPAHERDKIRFGLLTALRRDEFAELEWTEVDPVKQVIVIPARRMKNGEEHTVPLSSAALAILEARVSRMTDGEFHDSLIDALEELESRKKQGPLVFATPSGKPSCNWTPILRRIRKFIGESDAPPDRRFRLHDIRRSFTSILCEAGFNEDALDLMLAHKRSGMKAVYNLARLMPERKRAFDAWAKLLTGPVAETDNVLSFPTRSTM